MSLEKQIVFSEIEVVEVYVLSSDDVDRISNLIKATLSGFFELLESRKVKFPNSNWNKSKQKCEDF